MNIWDACQQIARERATLPEYNLCSIKLHGLSGLAETSREWEYATVQLGYRVVLPDGHRVWSDVRKPMMIRRTELEAVMTVEAQS